MPAESKLFKNTEQVIMANTHNGQFNLIEGGGNFKLLDACMFSFCTGGSNGLLADISSTPGTTTLIPASACPRGMRPYLTRLDIDVQGNTPWAGGKNVIVQDTNSAPLVYLPTNALRAMSAYTFPDSDTEVPIVVTAVSYVASTGVVTLPGTSLIAGAYSSNCIATVIGGTGIGQSELIASNTATSITPARGATAWPSGLDATSVIAVWYWSVTTGGTATSSLANQMGSATPLPNSNGLDNGYNVIVVSGTSVGGNRPVASNSTSQITFTTALNTATDATSLVHISNEQNLLGALDLCVGDKWPAAGVNTGIQVTVGASMSAGSNLRIYGEGYWGY